MIQSLFIVLLANVKQKSIPNLSLFLEETMNFSLKTEHDHCSFFKQDMLHLVTEF
jgi:hypothetical protein